MCHHKYKKLESVVQNRKIQISHDKHNFERHNFHMRATCNSTLGSLPGKQDFQRKNRLNSNKFKNILLTSQK